MNFRVIFPVTILVVALLLAAGCTLPTSTSGTPAGGTQSPSGDNGGSSGVSAAGNLVTSPTDVIPDYNMVTVDVGEKDYLGSIPVIFQGGKGQIHVTKIDVTLYRADGTTTSGTIGTKKGDELNLQGTKQTDRVVVWISFDNGQRMKTNDVTSAYRTRR